MDDLSAHSSFEPGVRIRPKSPRLLVEVEGSVALVTNAQSELGRTFIEGLIEGGAAKIYAIASRPAAMMDPRVHQLRLNMTSPADVARAVASCPDINLLVVHQAVRRSVFGLARRELESTVYNVMRLAQAFAPSLSRNGGGGLVNVLPSYARADKGAGMRGTAFGAAAVAVTEALRMELRAQGTAVLGVHPGDLDIAGAVDGRKTPSRSARRLVGIALEGIRSGQHQVFADSSLEDAGAFTQHGSLAAAGVW